MKYAIVQTSGKQFVIKPGRWYDVDLINNCNVGNFILLNRILLIRSHKKIQLGKPFLLNSKIPAKVIQEVKGTKITVLKTKPKKKYTRTKGNRQVYTRILITTPPSTVSVPIFKKIVWTGENENTDIYNEFKKEIGINQPSERKQKLKELQKLKEERELVPA